ncbi:hypothetical protein D1825_03885 [Cellulomonas rhizosphaerae]|uniref:Uncharacterized protein n=1 Tax=Cellulomonas rhizosphaerae TaxID=2293719 RepID=A0A413RPS1_9CELL|nr:hypothetical protein D1825_03885 [Cellulomonas rhizosphaerae]
MLWGVGAGVLAILIWVVEAHSFFRPLLAVAPVVVYAVVLLVRVVMEPRGERPALIPLEAVRRAPREGTEREGPWGEATPREEASREGAARERPAREGAAAMAAPGAGFDARGARADELEDALGSVQPD